MAEIKSTLDLIMEKTKSFSLSDEEKQNIRQQELTGKIRGWIQKYQDGLMDLPAIKSTMKEMNADKEILRGIYLSEILNRIEPAMDNARLLALIAEGFSADTGPVVHLLEAFQTEWCNIQDKYRTDALKHLTDNGISGSAVHPNLSADEKLNLVLEQMKEEFHNKAISLQL
jgi:hypothetical protein